MRQEQIEILHESNIKIKGNEPFLDYIRTGLIINLNDLTGRSHNFVERIPVGPGSGVPISKLKKGETLRLQLIRSYEVDVPDPSRWNRFVTWVKEIFK